MAKAIDKIKEWAKENVQLISILPENKNLQVETRLRDILEEQVDEKYYLSDEKTSMLVANLEKTTGQFIDGSDDGSVLQRSMSGVHKKEIYGTLRAGASRTEFGAIEIGPQMIGHVDINGNDICKRVYSADGVSPTVPTGVSGNTTPKVIEPKINVIGTTLDTGAQGTNFRSWVYEADEGLSGAVSATIYKQPTQVFGESTSYRIRKLTPLECFRLQGFPDSAHEKAAEVNSNSQRYKQAGNSVTVNVIYEIAKRLEVME